MHEHVQQKACTHPHDKLSSVQNGYNTDVLMHELAHTCNHLSSNNGAEDIHFCPGS